MSTQVAAARTNYQFAVDYSADELESMKRWNHAINEYNESVRKTNSQLANKNMLVDFIRLATFAVITYATAGTMSPIAAAALSIGGSAAAGYIADELYGPVTAASMVAKEHFKRRYKSAENLEKFTEFESSWDEYERDTEKAEYAIDQGHISKPLELAISFYGKKIMGDIFATTEIGESVHGLTDTEGNLDSSSLEGWINPETGMQGTAAEYDALVAKSQLKELELYNAGEHPEQLIDEWIESEAATPSSVEELLDPVDLDEIDGVLQGSLFDYDTAYEVLDNLDIDASQGPGRDFNTARFLQTTPSADSFESVTNIFRETDDYLGVA